MDSILKQDQKYQHQVVGIQHIVVNIKKTH